MRKKLLVLLAVAALIATVVAAPAGARGRESVRGHQDLDFNGGIVTGEGAAPKVSYVGTVDFRGRAYDIVYFPTAPLVQRGDWVYFEELVRIYEPGSITYTMVEGVLTQFVEGKLLVEFTDKGWGSPRGTAFAWGKVTKSDAGADPHGLLSNVDVGDRTFWFGRYLDEAHMHFGGPFRIYTGG